MYSQPVCTQSILLADWFEAFCSDPPESVCVVAEGKQAAATSKSASEASKGDSKQQTSKSAFGDRAERAFSDKLQEASSADIGRKSSAGYTGLNPTGTRSASRLFSSDPPAQSKAAAPMTKRDMVANSILQMQMDNELDTFTADIDCMWDSSDEEEEERPAAKGKKAEPAQGGEQGTKEQPKGGQKEGQKQDSREQSKQQPEAPKKKKQKGEYDDDDDDDDEEVDHANMEGTCRTGLYD